MDTIVTITGPTCSGKSTLAAFLSQRGIPEVQSFTTRAPRPGERQDFNAPYKYVDHDWVQRLNADDVVELVRFNGNYYGNTKDQLRHALHRGRGVATVVVEPDGAQHWKEYADQNGLRCYSIYLQVDKQALLERFTQRLKNAPLDSLDYEIKRMQDMLSVEHETWGSKLPYDLTIPNLDRMVVGSAYTKEMVLGHLMFSFQQPDRHH